MKILFHILTDTKASDLDKQVEDKIRILVWKLASNLHHQFVIHEWDSAVAKNTLLSILQQPDEFNVLIPGGNLAQAKMESILYEQSLTNILVLYNSSWDKVCRKKIKFGQITDKYHFNVSKGYNHTDAAPSSLYTLFGKVYLKEMALLFGNDHFNSSLALSEPNYTSEPKSDFWANAENELFSKIHELFVEYEDNYKEESSFTM